MPTPMLALAALLSACSFAAGPDAGPTLAAPPPEKGHAIATFAGGCFWCSESDFEKIKGVVEVYSGYTGGAESGPTYRQVSYGNTTHYEAVRIVFDPAVITWPELLERYWRTVDPTQANGQFCDRGDHYRTAVFVPDDAHRATAEKSKSAVAAQLGAPVVTEILPEGVFWLAEDYHQDFQHKDPVRYKSYREGCGRDAALAKLWGSAAH